jgi:hypothetical protein
LGEHLPRRNLDAGLAEGRLSRSGTVRISSYFRTLSTFAILIGLLSVA